jgi:Flp pilus assembly protein TadG
VRNFANAKKRRRESGYGLVFAAFGLIVLLGAAGMSVDIGYLRYQRRLIQSAADSAALAGAAVLGAGGGAGQAVIAARNDSQINGFQNGQPTASGTSTIKVDATQISFGGNNNTMQVVVTDIYPTFFMRIFGAANRNVTVSTTAIAQYLGGRGCIYALTGGTGINLSGAGNIDVPNCNVISNQNISGAGSITAAAVGAHGRSSVASTPAAVTGTQQTPDPLSYLAPPPIPGGICQTVNYTANKPGGQAPLSPGKYCSISFGTALSQPVTLIPGTYVITGNGGVGLSFRGSGTITGAGVTFYITGGNVQTAASQNLQLSAPNNGILFFQSNTNNSTATIAATGGSKLQGALYFPNATLNLNGGANNTAQYMLLVAKSLNIRTNVRFPSNYTSLANGYSPVRTTALIQ